MPLVTLPHERTTPPRRERVAATTVPMDDTRESSSFEHSPSLLIFCLRYLSTGKAILEDIERIVAAPTVAAAHHEKHHPHAQGHEKDQDERT
jgi:hypothetical protein